MLGSAHRAQLLAKFVQMVFDGITRRDVTWVEKPRQHDPRYRQHHETHRNAHQHPARKAYLDIVILRHEAHQQRIGRRADERGESADARGIGQAEQYCNLEIIFRLVRQIRNVVPDDGRD